MNFGLIYQQIPNIPAILFLSAVSSVVITSAIEVGTINTIDLNTDLKISGIANILSGLAGAEH